MRNGVNALREMDREELKRLWEEQCPNNPCSHASDVHMGIYLSGALRCKVTSESWRSYRKEARWVLWEAKRADTASSTPQTTASIPFETQGEALPAPAEDGKVTMTFSIPSALAIQLRRAVLHLSGPPTYLNTMSLVAASGIDLVVRYLQQTHNKGWEFGPIDRHIPND